MTADSSPEALFQQAVSSHDAGDFHRAEELYRRVLAVAPGHVGALRNLAALALKFGLPDTAAELLGQALAVRPDVPELHDQLGQVLCAKGTFPDAIARFEMALSMRPGYADAADHLARARSELALASDPDYTDVADSPWTSEEGIWEEFHGSSTVFVLFAGLGVKRSPPTFIFRNFLAPYTSIDKLFVRDSSVSWYLRGIPGISHDVETTAEFLKQKTRGHGRRVFIGTSAGAMAAILYGELVGVEKVIAFAPQTVLGASKPAELGDARWERRLSVLRAEPGVARFLDLRSLLPLQTAVDIYYPENVPLDRAHAVRISGPAVNLLPQAGDSHLLALAMRDSGGLRPIIERELPRDAG